MMTVKEVEELKNFLIEDQETIRTMVNVLEDALERIERLEERVNKSKRVSVRRPRPSTIVLTLDPPPPPVLTSDQS